MTEGKTRQPASDLPLPGDDFLLFVRSLAAQAGMALGVMPHPETGKREVQLNQARYFIDVLGLLEQKTKGNLTEEEAEGLGDMLAQLRMVFVEVKARAVGGGGGGKPGGEEGGEGEPAGG